MTSGSRGRRARGQGEGGRGGEKSVRTKGKSDCELCGRAEEARGLWQWRERRNGIVTSSPSINEGECILPLGVVMDPSSPPQRDSNHASRVENGSGLTNFELPKVVEVELIVAVQHRSRFFEDLLIDAELEVE